MSLKGIQTTSRESPVVKAVQDSMSVEAGSTQTLIRRWTAAASLIPPSCPGPSLSILLFNPDVAEEFTSMYCRKCSCLNSMAGSCISARRAPEAENFDSRQAGVLADLARFTAVGGTHYRPRATAPDRRIAASRGPI